MCKFFSFVTEPEGHGGRRFYFDWDYRKYHLVGEDCADSHSSICTHFGLSEDKCNKYEYNPFTRNFVVDQINSNIDDKAQVEEWVNALDFKRIVEPLIVKPIINPFSIAPTEAPGAEQIRLLKEWANVYASVGAHVWASVGANVYARVRDSVGASIWDSVWDSVEDSVGASVWASVRDSVEDSVGAYSSSFFDIKFDHDYSSCVKLWEMGLVPSFEGTTWRLHSGENADIVFEISKEELEKMKGKENVEN